MHERVQAARQDIAFLRVVVEDRGPLPRLLGWHLVAIGAIWGLDFVHIWAIFTGRAAWPQSLSFLPWLPALLLYLPANLWLNLRARSEAWGPSARTFGAAWAAMACMIPPAVGVLLLGGRQAGYPFYLAWPALAFVLYGGAWMLAAMVRRSGWCAIVAGGCFAAALACAMLIRRPEQWLVMAGGLLLLVALPGLIIARASPKASWLPDG